jgi:hypothetical protein
MPKQRLTKVQKKIEVVEELPEQLKDFNYNQAVEA